MKRIRYSFLLIPVVLVLALRCNNPVTNKREVFHMNISAGLTSLDPAFSKDQATMWCDNQIFNGLVQINEKLEVQPCIAKSLKISEDALHYEFYLRNDVFYHDHEKFPNGKGRKVVAQDFVYSFNR